jgi:hypothetical protein
MLGEERARLHRLPALPHTVCFGQARRVSWRSTISVGGALYSVPSELVDDHRAVSVRRNQRSVHAVEPSAAGRDLAPAGRL